MGYTCLATSSFPTRRLSDPGRSPSPCLKVIRQERFVQVPSGKIMTWRNTEKKRRERERFISVLLTDAQIHGGIIGAPLWTGRLSSRSAWELIKGIWITTIQNGMLDKTCLYPNAARVSSHSHDIVINDQLLSFTVPKELMELFLCK